MTTKIAVRINQEVVRTFTYTTPGNIALPEVGETLVHPKNEGSTITVQHRTFEYGEDRMKITLECI
ncbi:MAG: hypothetical protein WA414_05405 [Acidobacteriaceae bacterium]